MNIIYDYAGFVYRVVIDASTEKRLLDQVRDRLRLKNYAYRTEKSYLYWIKQYILFLNKRHPNEMGAQRLNNFSPIWLPPKKLLHQLKTRP